MQNSTSDLMLTVIEAAKNIGVSADTIRRWEKRGIIKAYRSELNYRLFNLTEIKRIHQKTFGKSEDNNYKILKSNKKSGYTCIDLFAGAGGTALGLENAGFKHILLNEIDNNSCETLKTNRPKWNIIKGDIKDIDFKKYKGVDIVEGGFPCQTFSYAGKKMGFEDARGTLFFEFARCVKETKPKIAIGENVKGLLRHDNGNTIKQMVSMLEGLGYRVAYKILRAQYLDVPQKRERVVIIGIRKDLKDVPFIYPKEQNYTISIREAFYNVPESEGQKYPKRKGEIMSMIKPGGYWRELPVEIQKEYMGNSFYQGGGKTGMARRLSWNEPSLTLTCAPAQKQTERCHPEKTRPLTIREYARIQTFPDDWVFKGTSSSQYKQIGNAVPTNLGYHIGRCVTAMLSGKVDKKTMSTYTNSGFIE